MLNRRVVITGMAGFSPIGNDWQEIYARLVAKQSGVCYLPDWDKYNGLLTRLGAPVENFQLPANYTRKNTRSMGRVSLLATRATELALIDADLLNHPIINSGRTGVSYGSSVGSTSAVAEFGKMLTDYDIGTLNATTYLKMMGHTTLANIAVFFQVRGRMLPAVSACTSGSQAIGFGYEAIKAGQQDVMLVGGAEELCPTMAALFDALYAASTKNGTPELTPRPFDRDRDGLVIGEGSCTLVLENLEHALARNAKIYAEVIGFATNADGAHVTQPSAVTMEVVMRLALQDAKLKPEQIQYISAHGTATEQGDIAESQATAAVFGSQVPISTLKSYTGHTLGACGALEAMVAVQMMRTGWFHPNLNLEHLDPRCAKLDYIIGDGRYLAIDYLMSNNFAFGGINTSLIFRCWDNQ